MDPAVAILPSLLAGDFGGLEAAARRAAESGADGLHLDIMDARFVPNLSMGPDVVRMARARARLPLNVHLMMMCPEPYLRTFIESGAATLLIHVEARCDVGAALRAIRRLGARPGLALNPETPADAVWPYLADADEVLCMTVHPGFGGQAFMPETLPKIEAIARRWRALPGGGEGGAYRLAVDGGIDATNVGRVAAAGANVIVAGSALFGAADMRAAVKEMREQAGKKG